MTTKELALDTTSSSYATRRLKKLSKTALKVENHLKINFQIYCQRILQMYFANIPILCHFL